MLTTAFWRTRTALASAFAAVLAVFAARRASAGRYSLAAARGVTFIEYALLAAIGVFISWLFREQLSDVFTSLLEKLQGGINDNSSTN